MKNKLLPLLLCIGIGLHGDEDRVRHVDVEKQKALASNSLTFPLPGRERRAGKKAPNKGEEESNAADPAENDPPEPPASVTNEVSGSPESFEEKIAELESEIELASKENKELNAKLKESLEDLNAAEEQIQEHRSEIQDLESLLDDGPGTIFNGWVFSQELKWVYLSPATMPYIYSQSDGWMLYEYGTKPRRVFYFKTKKWVLLDAEK